MGIAYCGSLETIIASSSFFSQIVEENVSILKGSLDILTIKSRYNPSTPGTAPYNPSTSDTAPYNPSAPDTTPDTVPYNPSTPDTAPYNPSTPGKAPYNPSTPDTAPYSSSLPDTAPYNPYQPNTFPASTHPNIFKLLKLFSVKILQNELYRIPRM
ncbi:uncharacterized protein LOC135155465 [Lytechinus pictus]|uniref:uncharacterized protein LOC135155465 n=1 Tax=Lytechinus pictus TaxID=7653 RepID=UPI0030B9F540